MSCRRTRSRGEPWEAQIMAEKCGPDQDPGGADQYLLAGEVWILVE